MYQPIDTNCGCGDRRNAALIGMQGLRTWCVSPSCVGWKTARPFRCSFRHPRSWRRALLRGETPAAERSENKVPTQKRTHASPEVERHGRHRTYVGRRPTDLRWPTRDCGNSAPRLAAASRVRKPGGWRERLPSRTRARHCTFRTPTRTGFALPTLSRSASTEGRASGSATSS